MQIKDFDELELKLNEIGYGLDKIKSLSKILCESMYETYNFKSADMQNLILVLDEKIIEIKEKFNLIGKELIL